MNKQESLALFAQGRDAWNAWAKDMLDKREALIAAGSWNDSSNTREWNDETRAWHAAAVTDFSKFSFDRSADFSDFVFPGDAEFTRAIFRCPANFSEVNFCGWSNFNNAVFQDYANFSSVVFQLFAAFAGTTFSVDASFIHATFRSDAIFSIPDFNEIAKLNKALFKGVATFRNATFEANAQFGGVIFENYAEFDDVNIEGRALFGEVSFVGNASFNSVTFERGVAFGRASFEGDAQFRETTFKGDTWFKGATFRGDSDFSESTFDRLTTFGAVEARIMFSLAGTTFLAVPDFVQAHFDEAPRLDDIRIEQHFRANRLETPLWIENLFDFSKKSLWSKMATRIKDHFKGDPDLAARWRALKRLAIQGHDHAREQMFFKGELKARRWSEDKPWHAVLWFGVFYQLLSDFGGSLWRPFLWWWGSVLGFAVLYLGQHPLLDKGSSSAVRWAYQRFTISSGEVPPLNCVVGPGEPWMAALNLSIQKGLLLPGLVPLNKLNQIYACLYGIHPADVAQPSVLPASFSPVIPDGVTILGFVQQPLSAVLIFLLLLAIRNHFRIK